MIQGIEKLDYIIVIAPVVFVLLVGIKALWDQNRQLTKDLKESDLENLKTLGHLAKAIERNNEDGDRHFDQLINHITERTKHISEQISQRK